MKKSQYKEQKGSKKADKGKDSDDKLVTNQEEQKWKFEKVTELKLPMVQKERCKSKLGTMNSYANYSSIQRRQQPDIIIMND